MKIEVTSLNSSNISKLSFISDDGESFLIATFNNGSVYKYLNVSLESILTVLRATSIGSAFNQLIKNDHEVVKINGAAE
jgi:hypothetical protein